MEGNKHGNLKCSACGSLDIRMHVGCDGADWDSEAGEGSGFDFGIDLVCEDCGRCYPVCRLKDEFAVSPLREKEASLEQREASSKKV